MSQAISTVAVKNTLPDPFVATKANSAASVQAAAAASVAAVKAAAPSSITTIGQQPKPDLGLFTKAGVLEKPPVLNTPASAPVAGAATFVAGKGDVVLDIQKSDSGYDNKIYYSTDNFKTKTFVGIDNHTGSINLGSFAEGTKIEFGIDNGVNQFYRTGAASTNSDNFQHAQVSKTADGIQIGFEDLAGGGDRDFNDAIISVRSLPPKSSAAPAPQVPVKDSDVKDNRSGLGDGTNPGQGAGRENSPNQGTNNPSNTTAAAVVKSTSAAVTGAAKAPAPIALPVPVKAPEPAAAKPPVVAIPVPAKPPVAAVPVPAKPPVVVAPEPAKAPVVAPPVVAKPPVTVPAPVANKPAVAPVTLPAPVVVSAKPVTSVPEKAPAASQPAPISKPVAATVAANTTKDNRSGLGDGTNPGQGAGRANSPNEGTNNPSNANSTVKPGVKI